LPDYRTLDYSVWKSCERVGIRPPGVKENFEDCDIWTQASILKYNDIREEEEAKRYEF